MPYKDRGLWRGVVYIQGRRNSKGFKTKREANAWEVEIKKVNLTPSTGMDLLTFSNQYLDQSKNRHTEKTYEEKVQCVKNFIGFLGANLLVSEITPRHVSDYLLKQVQTRSKNAANKDRKNLHAMWNWGQKILDLATNPVSKISSYPHARKSQYTPPEQDVLKVLAVSTGVDKVFLECYLHTGARRSEIFRLTWDDVNFERKEIRLWTRKTKDGSWESEWLPMTEQLYNSLKWWWSHRTFKSDKHVFIDDHPGPNYGNPYKVRRRFLASLCQQAGIRKFGFHALRRYVASILADKFKVSSKQIQRVLRHKNVHTTERYIQNLNRDLRSTMEFLDQGEGSQQVEEISASEVIK